MDTAVNSAAVLLQVVAAPGPGPRGRASAPAWSRALEAALAETGGSPSPGGPDALETSAEAEGLHDAAGPQGPAPDSEAAAGSDPSAADGEIPAEGQGEPAGAESVLEAEFLALSGLAAAANLVTLAAGPAPAGKPAPVRLQPAGEGPATGAPALPGSVATPPAGATAPQAASGVAGGQPAVVEGSLAAPSGAVPEAAGPGGAGPARSLAEGLEVPAEPGASPGTASAPSKAGSPSPAPVAEGAAAAPGVGGQEAAPAGGGPAAMAGKGAGPEAGVVHAAAAAGAGSRDGDGASPPAGAPRTLTGPAEASVGTWSPVRSQDGVRVAGQDAEPAAQAPDGAVSRPGAELVRVVPGPEPAGQGPGRAFALDGTPIPDRAPDLALAGAAGTAPHRDGPSAGTAPPLSQVGGLENAEAQIQEVVRHARLVQRAGGAVELRLRLEPKDLGQVDLRLVARGGQVQAEVLVSSQQARQAFELHLPRLKEALADQGVTLSQCRVDVGGGGAAGNHPGEQAPVAWPRASEWAGPGAGGAAGLRSPAQRSYDRWLLPGSSFEYVA